MKILGITGWTFVSILSASSFAAQWTVDPNGGGNFTGLQAAIDFAQAGDVIVVNGGCYAGIVIDKSLSIVGAGTIRRLDFPCSGGPTGDSCVGVACPAIEIGPTAGVVALTGFTVDGRWDAGAFDSDAEPTLRCAPGSDVRLYDCTVTGPIAWQPTGTQPMLSPAIESIGADLTLVRTTVTGAEHIVDTPDSGFWLYVLGFDGPPAIVGSEVLVLDSTVTGGTQGDFWMGSFDSNCPPSWPSGVNPSFHQGGTGIIATRVLHANSTIQGGVGATITNACSGGPGLLYNQQPAGIPIVASTVIVLANDLISSGPVKLGSNWTVNAAGSGGTIVMGIVRPDPIAVGGHGWLFLAPSLGVFLPGNSIAATVPMNSSLLGIKFGVQWVSPTGWLSRPVFEVIQP